MTRGRTYLGIYLNDHLAGAVAGVNLARRLAAREPRQPGPTDLQRLADELAEDRAALLDVMMLLDVPVRHYKIWAAWTVERLGRLKLNGRLLATSPLSRVLELEAMLLAVEGIAAGWRTLRTLGESDPRVDARRLDQLHDRARQQIDLVERLRLRAVAGVLAREIEPF